MGYGAARIANINSFFGTDGKLSFMDQIKSIYNGGSNSATVSADLASLNFSTGWQVTLGTNIQAGASSPTAVSTGIVPTLSSTSAGQATQNLLYGGTITAAGIYPLLAVGAANLSSPAGVGFMVDFAAKEGVDIQSFKSGTSTNVNNPSSHTSAQVEGYLQFNSTNLAPGSTGVSAGAFFIGGSGGYNYMSHGYARDYGFGTHVNNGIGQLSAGFLINNVAKTAVSRSFGPSQTYIDSTSNASTTTNYFKAWSLSIFTSREMKATGRQDVFRLNGKGIATLRSQRSLTNPQQAGIPSPSHFGIGRYHRLNLLEEEAVPGAVPTQGTRAPFSTRSIGALSPSHSSSGLVTSSMPTYQDSHYFATGTICWCAGLLLDGLVIGKQINHALRRVFVEEQLDIPVCLRSGGCAPRKKVIFVCAECGFNITRVGGYGLPEFRAVIHREIGSFASER